ncbi:MAG: hypothetical protein IPH62_08710 [Ignavibacteriae bacterium]|nr:hypothetical protein [Ignavibacteriota bacterium]
MFFNSEDKIKTITILIKEKDQTIIKSILDFLKDKYKDFSVMKYRTGKIGEDVLVSFKVNHNYYPNVLEKFAYNDIPVIIKDQSVIDYIDEKKELKVQKLRARGWKEIGVHIKQITFQELDQLISEGRIKEVAKEAKGGVGTNSEIVQKAKNSLTHTVDVAIENLIRYAEENPTKRQNAINELLDIATDSDLKLFQKRKEMIKAGEAAIALAINHEDLYDNLISIANNNKLENILNVKSTIYLSGIILSIDENNQELDSDKQVELPDVVRLLNTRWLKIAFETVQSKLSEEEKNNFNDLISFIEQKRKVA